MLNKTLTASTRLMLTGDVMLGRGIDQILPHHCSPELYESCIKDARLYTQLAIQNNGELPAKRDHTYPWGFALQDIEHIKPDARIINLETAITTHPTPWPQKGINYRMHPQNIPTITAAGVDVCTLANNHTLDWCEPGFIETLNTLHSAGIATAGAGHNLQQAQAPAVIHLAQNKDTGTTARVLVWSIGHSSAGVPSTWQAKPDKPGVFYTNLAPDDVQKMKDLVAQHKRPGDIILCSCHWGSNWGYQIPDQQKSFAHELIDKCDIDIVHGHSSHHVKAAEVYKDKLIIYGCGDLISDYEGITVRGSIDSTIFHFILIQIHYSTRKERCTITPMVKKLYIYTECRTRLLKPTTQSQNIKIP